MSYSSEVLADSPRAYYRLNDTTGPWQDSSGNGLHMPTSGVMTFSQTGALVGDADKAVLLSGGAIDGGLGQYSATNVMTVAAGATVEAWIKTSTAGRYIGGAWGASSGLFMDTLGASNRLRAYAVTAGGTVVVTSPTSSYADGTWHHIAAVYDGTALRLYVDGSQVASTASASTLNTSHANLDVGTRGGSGGSRFAGTVDEFAFYNAALSAARVSAHYAAGTTAPATTSTISSTRLARTAAFASVTVLASTMSAVVPTRTAAFTSDVVPQVYTSTIAATRTPRAAAFVAGTVLGSTVAAARLARTAAFTSEAVGAAVVSTIDATRPPRTAALVSDTVPGRFSEISATKAARIPTFASRAVIPVTPAPDVVTQAMSVVVALAHGAVTMNGTQPVYAASEAAIARGRQQIIVNGVDVTYFRDVVTPDVDYTLLEPLLYGPGSVEFPQIAACFETEGVGDLWWLRAQAPVEVNLVVDDVVVAPLYKGFVAAFDKSGAVLTVELGGEANGRAAMRDRQVPIFPRINDVGHQLADAVRDLGLPHYPPLGAVTGIEMMTTGGTGHLDHINNLVAKSWTRSGKQWTVMPDPATGVYETHRKDATTVHASAFIDDTRTVANLRRDIAEEPNQIFVTCVTPAGMRVRFGKYPGLVQGPVPDFPGSMFLGDSGEGVRLLTGKLHASGYLRLADVAGGYDDDVMRAVIQLQDDAGLPETGEVNLATWRALYDLDVTGLSLEWANIQPAAQRSKTRKFDRSANGTIMGFNDEYDSDVIVRHRSIDLGSGVTRKQAREYARTVLHDSDDANWVGDITFNTGALIRGEATVGMSLTAADVMDARELRPGMNLLLPAFDGGTLVHVSACQVSRGGVVTATVDTRFRDAMEVWEVIARNKESRNDPSRQRERRYRSSTIAKDSIGEWDEFGGFLGVDLPLERGWNKFPVVAAMEGQIHKLRVELETPAEFAVAVFGKEPDVGWLNDLIPHPLTVSGTKKWETERSALEDNWILYSAGTHDEPGGYWPGRKKWKSVTGEEANPDYDPTADANDTGTDDTETIEVTTEESFGTLTGKHVDDAGFRYAAFDRKVVWVAVFVRSENEIPLGRIMWPQLEAGV